MGRSILRAVWVAIGSIGFLVGRAGTDVGGGHASGKSKKCHICRSFANHREPTSFEDDYKNINDEAARCRDHTEILINVQSFPEIQLGLHW